MTAEAVPFAALVEPLPNDAGWMRIDPWPTLATWVRAADALSWRRQSSVPFDLDRLNEAVHHTEGDGMQHTLFADVQAGRAYDQWMRRRGFLDAIPPVVRARVRAFRRTHLPLLRVAAAGEWAATMLDHGAAGHPALAYGLAVALDHEAHANSANTVPPARVNALIERPRGELATHLGWPTSAYAIRLLQRIPPAALSRRVLAKAVRVAAVPASTLTLTRDTTLNRVLIEILSDAVLAPKVTPHFAWELGGESDRYAAKLRRRLRELVHNEAMGDERVYDQVRPFGSFRELAARSRFVSAELTASYAAIPPFPSPPVLFDEMTDGTAFRVVPITTKEELAREGRSMHHCIAQYARQIAVDRTCYAYRLHSPMRATLLLAFDSRRWGLRDARAVLNAALPQPLISQLRTLVRRSQWPLDAIRAARRDGLAF